MDSMIMLRAQITGDVLNNKVDNISSYFDNLDINSRTLRNYLYNIDNRNLMINDIVLLFLNDDKITSGTAKLALRTVQSKLGLDNVNFDSFVDSINEYREAKNADDFLRMETALKNVCDVDIDPGYKSVFLNLYVEIILSDKLRLRERYKDAEKYITMMKAT